MNRFAVPPALALILCIAFFLAAPLTSPTAEAQPANQAGVTTEQVQENELYGNFYYPQGDTDVPAVIVIGGSESGIGFADAFGPVLADSGFATLALPYHNYKDLPKTLKEIPLSYFDRAIQWVRQHPAADADRIGIIGHSRGGEAALLIASRNDAVGTVVASVPGAYTAPAVDLCNYPALSAAWSAEGEPLPYLPDERQTEAKREDETWREWYERTAGARAADERQSSFETIREHPRFEEVAIPVEKIRGPVLVLSAGEDETWASEAMSDYIVSRLRSGEFSYPNAHINYPEAGHLFFSPPNAGAERRGTPACGSSRWGGSEDLSEADQLAREASWRATIRFMRDHL